MVTVHPPFRLRPAVPERVGQKALTTEAIGPGQSVDPPASGDGSSLRVAGCRSVIRDGDGGGPLGDVSCGSCHINDRAGWPG